ncbi:MAG: hypothetical protein JRJ85_22995 [Deltaproteobacteria bacterium]|nr:hypothetical protein [Deltaproteobacteria bacterium]
MGESGDQTIKTADKKVKDADKEQYAIITGPQTGAQIAAELEQNRTFVNRFSRCGIRPNCKSAIL